MRLKGPSGLGRDSESKGKLAEVPQPRTVEAMCKANWPAQRRPTEAERATLKMATTRGLEGEPPWEAVVLPRVPGAGTGDVAARCKDNQLTYSTQSVPGPAH